MAITLKIIIGETIPRARTEEEKPKITVAKVIPAMINLPVITDKPQYSLIAAPPPENMILTQPNMKNSST